MAATERELVRGLQRAYSGELGAALAYRGHAASLQDPVERADVARIGAEEVDHRARLGWMLSAVGAAPDPTLERRLRLIGMSISAFCHVGGWFLPMYGAGWLERQNIVEYEMLARVAVQAGRPSFAPDLLAMAEAEWDHEYYFRTQAASHPLAQLIRVWSPPPARECIRQDFAAFFRSGQMAGGLPNSPGLVAAPVRG